MKIEMLQKGQIFKNYKELCGALEIPTKSGNTKLAQFKELERYCKYHKEGNKIVIDEIFTKEQPKMDNRKNNKGGNNVKYADDMEYLTLRLLNKLSTEEAEPLGFSKNLLYLNCGLINDNYKIAKGKTLHLSQLLDMPTQTINECFDYTTNKIWNTLRTTLNRLQRRALIKWGEGYNVVYIDDKGVERLEVANGEIITTILSFEYQTLKEMGYDNKRLVFISGQWKSFKDKVTELIREEFNTSNYKVSYYYDNITIYCNKSDVEEAFKEYSITTAESKEIKNNLNREIKIALDKTLDHRHTKAKTTEPTKYTPQHNYRKSDNYVAEQKQIKDIIVDREVKTIDLNFELDGKYTKTLNHKFNDEYKITTAEEIENNTKATVKQLSIFNVGYYGADDEVPF